MIDVTDSLHEINPTDRVFEVDGRFVKVRMTRETPPPRSPNFGVVFIRVQGSETGPDGRALTHGEGWRIAPAEVRTVMYDQPIQLAELLERIRREVVESTLRAGNLQDQVDNLLPS